MFICLVITFVFILDLVQFQIHFRYSDLTLNGNPIGKKSLNILLEQAFRGEIRLNVCW